MPQSLLWIRLQPRRDEKAAIEFEDVASQLDAGLTPPQIGGDPSQGDRLLAELLPRRRVPIDAVEDMVLVAAWQAGRGPMALRRLAEHRRQRAVFARTLLSSLRYPAVLVVLTVAVAIITAGAFGSAWLPTAVISILVLAAAGAFLVWRGLASTNARWLGAPLVGAWARDLAEIPYLEVLHSLYASGVPLLTAHAQAVAACPLVSVRAPLQEADALLQQRRPLAEALAAARAVQPETLQILATGERTGGLEEALVRALGRRRDTGSRRTATLSRTLGTCAYTFGLVVAVMTILTFYWGYAAALRGLR